MVDVIGISYHCGVDGDEKRLFICVEPREQVFPEESHIMDSLGHLIDLGKVRRLRTGRDLCHASIRIGRDEQQGDELLQPKRLVNAVHEHGEK